MNHCGTCKHFIGGGDWNLCCDQMYDLCYKITPACEKYEYSEETVKRIKREQEELNEYIRIMDI